MYDIICPRFGEHFIPPSWILFFNNKGNIFGAVFSLLKKIFLRDFSMVYRRHFYQRCAPHMNFVNKMHRL